MVLRAARSVLNQSYDNLELIVIDDSPEEFSQRLNIKQSVESLGDPRVRYILNEHNIGACASRNIGIKMCGGAYVMYVDDDDELLENNVFEKMQKFSNLEVGLVYSRAYIDRKGERRITKHKLYRGKVFDELIKNNFVGAFPLIRRDVFDKCGLFNEQLLAEQDLEFWLRASNVCMFDYVDAPLSIVYEHGLERITTSPNKKIQGLLFILETYYSYLKKHRNTMVIFYKRLSYYYLSVDYQKSKQYFWLCLKTAPFSLKNNLICLKWLVIGRKKHEQ